MKGKECSIRKAEITDAQDIYDMIIELAEYEELLDQIEITREMLTEALFIRKKAEALMIVIGEESVGYVVYFYNYSTFTGRSGLYVEDIYIKPKYRRNGYAKKAFHYLVALAVREDCGRMEWTYLKWNQSAISLYESLGATAMNEWGIYRMLPDDLERLL